VASENTLELLAKMEAAKLLEVSSIPKAQGGVRRRVVDAVQCGGDA